MRLRRLLFAGGFGSPPGSTTFVSLLVLSALTPSMPVAACVVDFLFVSGLGCPGVTTGCAGFIFAADVVDASLERGCGECFGTSWRTPTCNEWCNIPCTNTSKYHVSNTQSVQHVHDAIYHSLCVVNQVCGLHNCTATRISVHPHSLHQKPVEV